MSRRLVCDACNKMRRSEDKCPGIIIHPDVTCAACGTTIRTGPNDTKSRFHAVEPEDVEHIKGHQ